MVKRMSDVLPHPLDDEEIVRRVVDGDLALFEVVMRRHNQRLYRAALAIVSDPDEAEDVVQQAYLNAYAHLHQFESKARFATWLTRIAVHEAFRRLRKRRPRLALDEDGNLDTAEMVPSNNPERTAMNGELRDVLEAEIAALPEHYRVVFMLREIEEISTAETARLLGVTPSAIKTRLKRARERLRTGVLARAGLSRKDLFPFLGERCDRIVRAVLGAIDGTGPESPD